MGEEFPILRLPGLVGGGWRAVLGIPAALPGLITFIREVDFVHCHYSFLMAALGALLCRILGKPCAVTLHGLGTLDSSVDKSPLHRLYRFIALKLAGTIVATSEEMRTIALRFAPSERVVVIPNGVNVHAFAPGPKPESTTPELVILTMRRLAPKNGVQYLVEAAPEVVAALPQARFWVAGEGKLESALRRRVSELGLEEHFCFLGIVPHERTPEYYHQADLVVFPSSAESTSLACLEAMCCEKAIIASSLSAYKDMLGTSGERGILVSIFDREASDYNAPLQLPPERIHALAQAIVSLASDTELRLSLGKTARRFAVERYDWNLIAAQTARIYQEVRA
jgi:glycosyltransferase involved in cell wall biosynthesis